MKLLNFTIIMCIKDGEKFINEQIESIINQDFKNWELIIIDDCSVDNSLQIAQKSLYISWLIFSVYCWVFPIDMGPIFYHLQIF